MYIRSLVVSSRTAAAPEIFLGGPNGFTHPSPPPPPRPPSLFLAQNGFPVTLGFCIVQLAWACVLILLSPFLAGCSPNQRRTKARAFIKSAQPAFLRLNSFPNSTLSSIAAASSIFTRRSCAIRPSDFCLLVRGPIRPKGWANPTHPHDQSRSVLCIISYAEATGPRQRFLEKLFDRNPR